MVNFTVIKSHNSSRVTIYSSDSKESCVCSSIFGAYSFFEMLRRDADCKSVTYTATKDDNVILVKIQ